MLLLKWNDKLFAIRRSIITFSSFAFRVVPNFSLFYDQIGIKLNQNSVSEIDLFDCKTIVHLSEQYSYHQ